MRNAGLDELQTGIKIEWRNINNLRYVDDITLMAESEEELKNLLMRVKEESEKLAWNSAFKKLRSWQIEGEKLETVTDFLFLGSKITADGDCSHEIKWHLLLGRKVMTNLDSILKSRDITDKGLSSQSYGFSSSHVWMWELDHKESWALKTDAFELWCWRRLLRVPWTARRSN